MTPRPARRPRSVVRALAALVALPLLLSACAVALPEPDPDPTPPAPLPVLEVGQIEDVLADVGEVLVAGDAALDPALLGGRVGDPALSMRSAQYTLATRSDGARPLTALTVEDQVLVVAATDTWPRSVAVITTVPEGATVPLLLVLDQADARSPYLLRSWVRLFPGVETPQFAGPEVGSPVVAPDADGFVATPAAALTAYADVLANGEASASFPTFGADRYIEQLTGELAANRTALEGIADVTFAAAPAEGGLTALGTADGGVLVVGTITSTTTYAKTLEGATITLGGPVGEWLGDGTVGTTASATYTSTVAFAIPVAAEGATITVLGAERVLVDAAAS